MAGTSARDDLNTFSSILRKAILECSSVNDSLRLLRVYARLHCNNISGFFDDSELEEKIFKKWFSDFKTIEANDSEPINFLHVASRLYTYGGHTPLLTELVKGLTTSGSQKVILTNQKRLDKRINISAECYSLKGSPILRLRALLAQFSAAKNILLHIHPDDSVAALAARIANASGKRVLFVNHADHIFNLGSSAADVVLEVSMTGWKTTKGHRKAQSQSFMGVPSKAVAQNPVTSDPNRSGPIISMGSSGKYEPATDLDFPKFVERMLPKVKNDFVFIGPSIKDTWWRELQEKYPDRISLLGYQPSDRAIEILLSASCYIDSFPLEGGTAYPQAVTLGLICFGPNAQEASGFSPADQLRFDTVDQMENAVVNYLETGEYPFDLASVKKQIAVDFSNNKVADRVIAAANGLTSEPMKYLQDVGKRGADYNARRFDHNCVVKIPSRQWRGVGFRERAKILILVRKSKISDGAKSAITRRIFRWMV